MKHTAVTELKAILKSELVASIFERVEPFIDKAIISEREQIEEAFDEGNPNGFILKNGKEYFTQTYKR